MAIGLSARYPFTMSARAPKQDTDAALERLAQAGDPVALALVNAQLEPLCPALEVEMAAGLAAGKARAAAGDPAYSTEQILALIDARRLVEQG